MHPARPKREYLDTCAMPVIGRVGKAPRDLHVSYQGDPHEPWYAFVVDDAEGETGGFFVYWSQSPTFRLHR